MRWKAFVLPSRLTILTETKKEAASALPSLAASAGVADFSR
jgi:hypothetical protein